MINSLPNYHASVLYTYPCHLNQFRKLSFHDFFFLFILQMIKMMVVVVLLYAVCWLPLHALQLATDENPEIFINVKNLRYIWVSFQIFSASHSCYYPFVYFWMNRKFRKAFQLFFLRCLCCAKRGNYTYGDIPLSPQTSLTMTWKLGRHGSRFLSAKRIDSV